MNICILDANTINPGDLSWDPISDLGRLSVFERMKPLDVITHAADAEVILTNKVPLGRDMMDLLTRLKYVGVLATGYNNIDVNYAHQLGLPVTNIPGYSTDSVVQSVMAFLLHISNNIADYNYSVKGGDWETSADFSYLRTIPFELSGKTIGVIGYGAIGSQLAAVARSFGMKVIVGEKPDGTLPGAAGVHKEKGIIQTGTLAEVFSSADIISLHVPLTENTKSLVSEKLLAQSKRGQIIINTARGGIVDDTAVQDALDDGILSWYASDVFSMEPPESGASLIHHPKTIFTPHISWASREARQRAIAIAAANIEAWKRGTPVHVVNSVDRGRV